MTQDTTKTAAVTADTMLFEDWFDPIEDGVRERVRGFIEAMLEEELEGAWSRPRTILPMRTWVSSSGTVSVPKRPRSMAVLSCTNAVITSFRSSVQMRAASGLSGVTSPLISIWIWPVDSLKPTLLPVAS